VFLCADQSDKLCAIKVLNVERDRKEYNWTWLTAEERQQSQKDAKKLRDFISNLEPGLVRDHMVRAEEMLLDTMKREENPLLRKVRRPVAEREILLRIGPHPFVANLLHSFRDNRFMCLVFDYFPSGTLQKFILSQGKLDENLARFFASQLLLGLIFLQSRNVAHRDVKPSNILLTKDGFIALADFGLATRLKGGLKTFCGTAEYIAPEVLSEKMWSASGLDLWAFGICLYQMLVGKTPFEAPDATSVFLNTLTSQLKFPDHVSPEAKELLTRLLSKDASKRPSGEEVKSHVFFQNVDWDSLLKRDESIIPKDLASKLQISTWSVQELKKELQTQQASNKSGENTRSQPRFESLLK
jgi:protein kinase A